MVLLTSSNVSIIVHLPDSTKILALPERSLMTNKNILHRDQKNILSSRND
jgi:hypothetical protein